MMRTFFFLPPLAKVSGGMAVLIQLAGMLQDAGYTVFLAGQAGAEQKYTVPILDWRSAKLDPEDRWVVPEGWFTALAAGLQSGAQCLMYVQNWAYVHGQMPSGVLFRDLPLRFLAVSQPVAWFLQETCGVVAPVLRPSVDAQLFYPYPARDMALPPAGKIRIAWMPRKNRALARQIRDIFEARAALSGDLPPREWLEIHDRTHAEVAELLRSAHIFLITGFPEGCPLPPLEAMASGCLVAGFTGFGGWDYMRQSYQNGFLPSLPLCETEWQGNGFFAPDGDVLAAAFALEQAVRTLCAGGERLARLRHAAALTAAFYSQERQRAALAAIWRDMAFWTNLQTSPACTNL